MARPALHALALGVALVACAEDLEPPSQLRSLRVLAVTVDTPFAPPGATPTLSMALVDAAPGASPGGSPRPLSVVWLGGCDNPPQDAHGACREALRSTVDLLSDQDLRLLSTPATAQGRVGFGTSFSYRLPEDLIARHPTPPGTLAPYGLSYVFFAACGGELRRAPAGEAFPLRCVDPASELPLDAQDFVTGYTRLWAYTELRNQNPLVQQGALLENASSRLPCADDLACAPGEACGVAGVCLNLVARCEADGADACPGVRLQPRIDRQSAERAETAAILGDAAPLENLWVAYFTQRGRMDADARFVHDGALGWSQDFSTTWRAPREGGEVRLWAVVRDSRGGVSWAFEDVLVR
ncbi:MAG: hypothetical protein MUF64_17735 [Polyangiaceae bacterium]|jgi:hypothetical protein|nr:hypothetical protein [Polyangiaceae bacterium]